MRRSLAVAGFLAGVLMIAQCGQTSPSPVRESPTVVAPPLAQPPLTTYSLSGVVKEAWIDTGLPGATVTIASGPSRGFAMTDAQGRYTLPNLLPGIYSVTFSKPAPYGRITYSPIDVSADATFSGALSLSTGLPLTATNLQGYWVAQGPYPNEPCWILIFQDGTRLTGWYKDRQHYSTTMSGSYTGDVVLLDVGVPGLTIEGRVQDARCIRAFIKNEALGGNNFPVTMSRGGNCSR